MYRTSDTDRLIRPRLRSDRCPGSRADSTLFLPCPISGKNCIDRQEFPFGVFLWRLGATRAQGDPGNFSSGRNVSWPSCLFVAPITASETRRDRPTDGDSARRLTPPPEPESEPEPEPNSHGTRQHLTSQYTQNSTPQRIQHPSRDTPRDHGGRSAVSAAHTKGPQQ